MLREEESPLLLDEAQELNVVMECIHNGMLERPVVLVAAGLGVSKQEFESLGISRFGNNCLVELGALDRKAERAVLHDWLVQDGGARANDLDPCMNAITRETHCWPHHIMSYVEPALEQLIESRGAITDTGLVAVLQAVDQLREAYYEARAENFEDDECQSLSNLIAEIPPGGGLGAKEILSLISEDLFHRAIQKGILYRHKRIYTVPIPTLRGWFAVQYPPERNRD